VKLLTSEEIDVLSTTFPETQKPLLIAEFSAKQKRKVCVETYILSIWVLLEVILFSQINRDLD
jgi:hypothetical protein